jgi:hypothetical protein
MKYLYFLIFLVVVNRKKCSPLNAYSYATPQVRAKFKRINDSTYFNPYSKTFLIQRADGRWYPCK